MPCNCGRNRKKKTAASKPAEKPKDQGKTQQFELRTATGRTMTFGSRLEADAANTRSGGRGVVRPA